MGLKTWLVAALGLGSLVVLIAVSLVAASQRVQDLYVQLDQLNAHYRGVDVNLRRLRSDVNLSGIFVRDYLLDVAREKAPEYREQLSKFRQANMATLAELRALINRDDQIASLQSKLDDYWESLEPLFDWTPAEKIARSAGFLRREVVPRREAALAIAQQIEELNNSNLAAQQHAVAQRHAAFRSDLDSMLRRTVFVGLVVALVVVVRLRVLERQSAAAGAQMRQLSQQLVNAQEEERKNLSRELHDDIAQVLTGLRMELGRIDRLHPAVGPAVHECKRLVDAIFATVRDLALGLRPAMLDDSGLQAAVEWHVRDFMRRYAIDVELRISGELNALPDKYRTCVYRVLQEAMTNCVRHAHAKTIRINLSAGADWLHLSVSDDGVGLDPAQRRSGLGLRGIRERVAELNGTLAITSNAQAGTSLSVKLPLPLVAPEVSLARAAR
jgi:signal transduction histidine kinase